MTANTMPSKHAAPPRFTRRGALSLAGFLAVSSALPTFAQDASKPLTGAPADAVTRQRYKIAGADVAFTVTAGTLPMVDSKGERVAWMFYVAYTRDGAPRDQRPVTFAFNGGPGASSAYLHLGTMGPKIANFGDGPQIRSPARLVDNPDSWLDLTDLVFIDPIGTAYSRTVSGTEESNKRFWSVRGDVDSLAAFIDLYLARNGRQGSPKYLVGESYGGFRAARLAQLLSADHGIAVSGLFLVSPVIDFSLITRDGMSVLPDALLLPSYAAVALERKAPTSAEALADVERFALGPYLTALSAAPPKDADLAAAYDAVAKFTGLPRHLVAQYRGRVPLDVFVKEVGRSDQGLASHYDGSLVSPDPFPETANSHRDPAAESLRSALGSAMPDYLTTVLGVRTDIPYLIRNPEIERRWDWWSGLTITGGYVSAASQLREALAGNPALKVAVAHGMTDLVTPYFTSRYLLDHLPSKLAAGRTALHLYNGGHMMYLRPASRAGLHTDAAKLYPAAGK